jgi:flagellar basal body-associated protein FliL
MDQTAEQNVNTSQEQKHDAKQRKTSHHTVMIIILTTLVIAVIITAGFIGYSLGKSQAEMTIRPTQQTKHSIVPLPNHNGALHY